MKKLWKNLSALSLVLFASATLAKAPVWEVSKGGQTVYLGGTVHLLAQSDYPLPAAFDNAYNKSQILVLETDMNQMQSPQFQQEMLKAMTYQDGRTYADVLKPKTVERLNAYLKERQLPVANFQTFKPSMLSITLMMVELQRLGLGGTGVDMFYAMRGQNDNKQFKFLELPQEQIDFISKMGEGFEDEFINYTLDDMGKLAESMGKMKDAWRSGENQKLFDVAAKEWKEKFPQSYNSIIVTRNNNWIDDIEGYFKSKEVEFVLVGALHLVGEDGVLKILQEKGYTIKQL